MPKVDSRYLLLTLVFSTAHAPTLGLWRSPPVAQIEQENAPAAVQPGIVGTAPFSPGKLTAALQREYAEEGEIKRFQLDESYLPNLDVSLPELFDWSDIERTYFANARIPDDALGFIPGSPHGPAFRIAALGAGGGSGSAGGMGGVGASASGANDELAGRDTNSPGPTSTDGSTSSQPNGDETPPDDSSFEETPNGNQTPPGDSETEEPQLADNETSPSNTSGQTSSDDSTSSQPNRNETPPDESNFEETPNSSETPPGDSKSEEPQLADNETDPDPIYDPMPTENPPPDLTYPITDPTPVPVPAPGTFGLFALGLAGLHLAGRKKNRSG